MAEEKFSAFDTEPTDIVMPSVEQNLTSGALTEEQIKQGLKTGADLVSEGLERAIGGETVKAMMIPEDTEIALPNYVIDFSSLGEIYDFQMEALDALLHPDGDVILYAYTKGGLAKLGRGQSSVLDRIITLSIANLFASRCNIYKDFQPGEPLKLVSEKDITTMRLSI